MSNFIRNSRNLESHPLQAASGKLQVLHFWVLFSLPFESGASTLHSFFSVGIFPWLFPLCQVCQISESQVFAEFWTLSLIDISCLMDVFCSICAVILHTPLSLWLWKSRDHSAWLKFMGVNAVLWSMRGVPFSGTPRFEFLQIDHISPSTTGFDYRLCFPYFLLFGCIRLQMHEPWNEKLPATYVCFVILLVHDHQKDEDLFLFVYWAFQRAVHDRDLEIIEAHFDIATECSSGHQTGDSDGNEVDLYKLPWHFFFPLTILQHVNIFLWAFLGETTLQLHRLLIACLDNSLELKDSNYKKLCLFWSVWKSSHSIFTLQNLCCIWEIFLLLHGGWYANIQCSFVIFLLVSNYSLSRAITAQVGVISQRVARALMAQGRRRRRRRGTRRALKPRTPDMMKKIM